MTIAKAPKLNIPKISSSDLDKAVQELASINLTPEERNEALRRIADA